MSLREAAQQALEALVDARVRPAHKQDFGKYEAAITALRAALAEPEPVMHQYKYQAYGYYKEDGKLKLGTIPEPQTTHWEGCKAVHPECRKPEQAPMAWANEIIDDLNALYDSEMIREIDSGDALIRLDSAIAAVEEAEQRYTAPTPRKPLTDEEIDRVTDQQWAGNNHKPIYAAHRAYARAIERAHGIGDSNGS